MPPNNPKEQQTTASETCYSSCDYHDRKHRKDTVIQTLQSGDWRSVLSAYDDDDTFHEPLLVWIRPSLSMLLFLQAEMEELGISGILSIGCGCATLECLINHATSIKVEGLEVNAGWWQGRYSTPPFIPLTYTEPGIIPALPSDKALLFSYFNGLEQFESYLRAYGGKCVILIGPVDGRRHCAPEPFHLSGEEGWRVKACHDIRGAGQDNVVVYVRT